MALESDSALLLRQDNNAVAILDELSRPLEERLLGPLPQAGYDPPPPILAERLVSLEVRYTERGTTLTAAPYQQDPLVAHEGWLRAPNRVLESLAAYGKNGIDPDPSWCCARCRASGTFTVAQLGVLGRRRRNGVRQHRVSLLALVRASLALCASEGAWPRAGHSRGIRGKRSDNSICSCHGLPLPRSEASQGARQGLELTKRSESPDGASGTLRALGRRGALIFFDIR
jgi:hypothetical protein